MGGALVQGLLGFFGGAAQGAHEKIGIDSERKHTFSLEDVRHRNTMELESFRQTFEREIEMARLKDAGIARSEQMGAEAGRRIWEAEATAEAEARREERSKEEIAASRAHQIELDRIKADRDAETAKKGEKKERMERMRARALQVLDSAEDVIGSVGAEWVPDDFLQDNPPSRLGGGILAEHDRARLELLAKEGKGWQGVDSQGRPPIESYIQGSSAYTAASPYSSGPTGKSESIRSAERVMEVIQRRRDEKPEMNAAADRVQQIYSEIQRMKDELSAMSDEELYRIEESFDLQEYNAKISELRDAVRTWGKAAAVK